MKKVYAIIAALSLFAGAASAQGLGGLLGALGGASGSDILDTVSKVVYAYTGNTSAVDLTGNWTYTGSAIKLGSDNTLTNVAGTAVSTGMEQKVNEYLQKVGITSGSMKFTFNEDLTFTCTVKGVPVNGTWKTLDEGTRVQLQFGKTLKYLSMTGSLQKTATGCQMLFEGTKFLKFIKTILQYVGTQNASAGVIGSLAGNYSSMQIGCTLQKN